jgi:hypothetical protein
MKLEINDVGTFQIYLNSVLKFVNMVEFEVSKDFTKIMARNEAKTVKGFFVTNSMTYDNDTPVTFCFSDLRKLNRSINLVKSVENNNKMNIKFDGTFLNYNGKTSFKLKTVKRDIVERYTSAAFKGDHKIKYSFTTSTENVKRVIQANAIIANTDAKVYISKKDSSVIAEVDDKSSRLNDSIGIPIADKLDNGNISSIACLKFTDFMNFSILHSPAIKVEFTNKNAYLVDSEIKNNKKWIKMKLGIPLIKQ